MILSTGGEELINGEGNDEFYSILNKNRLISIPGTFLCSGAKWSEDKGWLQNT